MRKEHLSVSNEVEKNFLYADKIMLAIIFCHALVGFFVTSRYYEQYELGFFVGGTVLAAVIIAYWLLRGSIYFRLIAATSLMIFSALYIQQHLGRIEMHFHVFIGLAILTIYKDYIPMLWASAVIALHHYIFNYFQSQHLFIGNHPVMVFNYGCGIEYVYLHAIMVAAEAVVLFVIIQSSTAQFEQVVLSKERERENSALRKTLLDNSAVGIFLASADRVITQASKRAYEMFGYTPEEIVGRSFRLIHISDESFLAFTPEYGRLSGDGITNIQYPFRRKDGTVFWCSVNGTALESDDITKGVIWTLLDVDEQRKVSESLKQLNAELAEKVTLGIEELRQKDILIAQQAKLAAMGEMIGNIAHQWRQPLNSLMAAKDLLVIDYFDNVLTGEDVHEYSVQTTLSLKYLSKTIDDFRHFFSTSKDKKPFDIVSALKSACSIAMPSLSYRSIKLHIEPIEKSIIVIGFENEFQQVVINLINNAKDAISVSGVDGIVTVKATATDDIVRITIEDNGGGIKSDVIDKIFEPYFTTKFKSQGTGLGLYMAKTIIETNMQGRLSVSNGEKGAIFTIELHSGEKKDA